MPAPLNDRGFPDLILGIIIGFGKIDLSSRLNLSGIYLISPSSSVPALVFYDGTLPGMLRSGVQAPIPRLVTWFAAVLIAQAIRSMKRRGLSSLSIIGEKS